MARDADSAPLLQSISTANGGATSLQTLGNAVVSMLGTGVLGLPFVFSHAGLLSASLGLAIACFLVFYCMVLLVDCRRTLEDQDDDNSGHCRYQTYGDLGGASFGAAGRCFVEVLILVAYAGGAISFLIFIGQNLSSVFPGLSSSVFILFILLPFQMGLSFIRSISVLVPFSALANVCNALALAIIFAEDMKHIKGIGTSVLAERRTFNGVSSLCFAFSVAVYCFDGSGMTLALEASMAKRKKFPLVLLQAFVGLLVLYTSFGICGYLAFADKTKDIITLNLSDSWPATIVKVGQCVAIAFSFPMVMYPINEIVEAKLNSATWFQNMPQKLRGDNWFVSQLLRMFMIVLLAFVATSVPGFLTLVSFMGSTICGFLCFILPAAFHLRLMSHTLRPWLRVLDYCIICIGLAFTAYGFYDIMAAQ